jgi:hypothetical protein
VGISRFIPSPQRASAVGSSHVGAKYYLIILPYKEITRGCHVVFHFFGSKIEKIEFIGPSYQDSETR